MVEIPSLGARGGGWVTLQFALLATILAVGLLAPGWPDAARWWLKGAGVLLVFGGALLIVLAGRALGSGLTPFPKPAEDATLVESGPYAVVRHPVYTGGILFAAGISLALSPWALVATALLVLVWALKAGVEERLLAERYPAYAEYRERTRYRLIPYLY
ncbi:MAG TPA: isoprenylcysteine carboxylmethyltransferase family protein [Gaiellaceae bacterium]|nr:isoprenylcysteine carboxylmethyltransferase family protein [Gaiellaceae bacterium]